MQKYAAKLKSGGLNEKDVELAITIISARDEASLYDPIFAKPAKFRTSPNPLLMEALKNRAPAMLLMLEWDKAAMRSSWRGGDGK